MSKKRRKGGFCEKRTKLDTRYEKREGFEKKWISAVTKHLLPKYKQKIGNFFFFNYKNKYVFFLDDGERKGLFEFWDNVGLG